MDPLRLDARDGQRVCARCYQKLTENNSIQHDVLLNPKNKLALVVTMEAPRTQKREHEELGLECKTYDRDDVVIQWNAWNHW